MHRNKIEAWIGGESGGGGGVSSDLSTDPPILLPSSISQKHPTQVQTPTNQTTIRQPNGRNYWAQIPNRTRLEIHVSIPNSPEEAPHFHDQPIFGNPNHGPPAAPPQAQTTQAHLLSTPHKRPVMMTQAPPASSLSSYRHRSATDSQPESSKPSYCSSSSPSLPSYFCCFSPRTLALKLLRDVRRARLLRVHLRFLILISLPSLYFFSSNPHRSFLVNFLFVLSFSAALVISLKLALPRLPSIRLFLARSLPTNIASLKNRSAASRPVLWSIGSKPKPEKRPNSGSWVQSYSNGDVYEGEFHKGKCSGSGVYYYHMSGKYEGDWVDEKYDGFGVETWAKGSRYRGQYRLGLRHGLGVYRFYTGDVYAGEWSNGQSHGRGVHTCEDGSRYVGEFKWGVKHGLGHYHFRNGDTYAGEYFSDKVHGFGVYRFGNGHQYEGAWHEGRRQGLGMYTFRSGEIQSGHWQNGVLNVPSSRNSQPGSSYAVNHSKVLNAVQEARRAAEKAFDVGRVDERVNKAVAAANRAANAARVAAVKAVQKQMHHNNDNGDLPMPHV